MLFDNIKDYYSKDTIKRLKCIENITFSSFRNDIFKGTLKFIYHKCQQDIDYKIKTGRDLLSNDYKKIMPENIYNQYSDQYNISIVVTSPKLPNVQITIFSNKTIKISFIENIIKKIYATYELYRLDSNNNRTLNLTLLLNNNKRILHKHKIIDNIDEYIVDHPKYDKQYKKIIDQHKEKNDGLVVGGITFSKHNNLYDTILMTKKEDISRLLIHELMHYFLFDYNLYANGNNLILNWNLEKKNVNINETFAETMSIIISTMINACIYGIQKHKTLKEIHRIFICFLNIEIAYSTFLTIKILHFYGYNENNIKDFFNNKSLHPKFKQPIYLLEYIILRCFVMNNLYELFNDKYIEFQDGICLFKIKTTMIKYLENMFESQKDQYIEHLRNFWNEIDVESTNSISYVAMDMIFN